MRYLRVDGHHGRCGDHWTAPPPPGGGEQSIGIGSKWTRTPCIPLQDVVCCRSRCCHALVHVQAIGTALLYELDRAGAIWRALAWREHQSPVRYSCSKMWLAPTRLAGAKWYTPKPKVDMHGMPQVCTGRCSHPRLGASQHQPSGDSKVGGRGMSRLALEGCMGLLMLQCHRWTPPCASSTQLVRRRRSPRLPGYDCLYTLSGLSSLVRQRASSGLAPTLGTRAAHLDSERAVGLRSEGRGPMGGGGGGSVDGVDGLDEVDKECSRAQAAITPLLRGPT